MYKETLSWIFKFILLPSFEVDDTENCIECFRLGFVPRVFETVLISDVISQTTSTSVDFRLCLWAERTFVYKLIFLRDSLSVRSDSESTSCSDDLEASWPISTLTTQWLASSIAEPCFCNICWENSWKFSLSVTPQQDIQNRYSYFPVNCLEMVSLGKFRTAQWLQWFFCSCGRDIGYPHDMHLNAAGAVLNSGNWADWTNLTDWGVFFLFLTLLRVFSCFFGCREFFLLGFFEQLDCSFSFSAPESRFLYSLSRQLGKQIFVSTNTPSIFSKTPVTWNFANSVSWVNWVNFNFKKTQFWQSDEMGLPEESLSISESEQQNELLSLEL